MLPSGLGKWRNAGLFSFKERGKTTRRVARGTLLKQIEVLVLALKISSE